MSSSMQNRLPAFVRDAKAEHIRPPIGRHLSSREASRQVGVWYESLRHWLKQADIDASEREEVTSEERGELRGLCREVRRLREEREILKRAVAFFAKESETR